MTSYISTTFAQAVHYFQHLVVQVVSGPFTLARRILDIFRSRVFNYIPSSQKNYIISKTFGEKKVKAATKIQCIFRKKLVATKPHILSKVKNIQNVSENYIRYPDSDPNLSRLINNRWEAFKRFVKPLKKDHYVFAHASSFAHSFFVDLRTHLNSSLFPASSSRWTTHRKFRAHSTPQPYKKVSEYFKSDLCKKIDAGITNDDHNSSVILSCDGHLDNKRDCESAFAMFNHNSSISFPNTSFRNSVFKEHIQNTDICKFTSDYYNTTNSLNISDRWGQGRVYFIAIPKKNLQDQKTCYVWRSHEFGVVCNPPPSITKTPHQEFIEVLDKHQKGKSVSHHNNDCPAQYRMLAANLDRDLTKKVFAIDSLLKSQKEPYKEHFWAFASLLKQIQRLESISEATSQETLKSILLRIRFDANHLPSMTPEMNNLYKKGLKSILASKKEILMAHRTYLQKKLPKSIFTNILKVKK